MNVDVMLTGGYPGDGQPKPVAFPFPADVNEPDPQGIPVLTLPVLLTLKLASGMTAPHRPRDLDRKYADQLDHYVHRKYLELWEAAQVQDEY